MTVTRNGEPAGDYGRQDAVPGELALSYGAFYGGDDGEIIFDTGRPTGEICWSSANPMTTPF